MDQRPQPSEPAIPRILHSMETGQPFRTCIECGSDLDASTKPYGIEKVLRQGEVIFEYAICADCTFVMMREFSKESLQRMAAYAEALRRELRDPEAEDLDRFLRALEGDTEIAAVVPEERESLDHCHRCGGTGDSFQDEHTIVGVLSGKKLVTGVSMVCGRCTDGMEDILSKHTRDRHEGFVEKNFPGVPAGLDLPVGLIAI